MLLIIFMLTGILVSILVALLVFLRNPQSVLRRWLVAFLIASSAWVFFVNLQGVFATDTSVLLLRTAFVSAILMGYCMLGFVLSLCRSRQGVARRVAEVMLLVFAVALSYSPLVIAGAIETPGQDLLRPERGAAYPVILVIILYFTVSALVVVMQNFLKSRGLQRSQLLLVFGGLLAGTVIGITTNIILPNLTHTTYPSRFAFIAIIIWTTVLTYAIWQHRLFDIRLAAARTLGYSLALLVTVGIYGVGIVIVADYGGLSAEEQALRVYFVVATAVAVLSFGPTKRFFDRFTDKIFYRGEYDFQQVVDRLGQVMAEEVGTAHIMSRSGTLLYMSVKPDFLQVLLLGKDSAMPHAHTSGHRGRLGDDLLDKLNGSSESVIVADDFADRPSKIQELLLQERVAIAIRIKTSKETIGYMMAGYKRNGYVFTKQDVELLHIAGDQLAIALQNAQRFEKISQFNITLKQEVADATAELRKTNQKLRELDKAKDEFLSMASHQLRTPLTSVKGYLSMALEGDAGKLNEGQKSLLKESYGSAQRMVYLVNDFLNVSRIKTGKFAIDRSSVALQDVIKQEVMQLQPAAHARGIKFDIDVPHGFERLRLDESKVRQVVMNLIDNAIYYSKEGGRVTITLRKLGGWAELTVEDHGIGVPSDEQSQMFDKFFRATNAKKARSDGTGVGLFVAKKVITAHGGQMIFSSQQGKGSVFGFRLPLDQPDVEGDS